MNYALNRTTLGISFFVAVLMAASVNGAVLLEFDALAQAVAPEPDGLGPEVFILEPVLIVAARNPAARTLL